MASLALDNETRAAPEHPSKGSGDLIDARAIAAELEQLAQSTVMVAGLSAASSALVGSNPTSKADASRARRDRIFMTISPRI